MDILEQLKAQGIEVSLPADAEKLQSMLYHLGTELSQGRAVEVTGTNGVLYSVTVDDGIVRAVPLTANAVVFIEPNAITKNPANVRISDGWAAPSAEVDCMTIADQLKAQGIEVSTGARRLAVQLSQGQAVELAGTDGLMYSVTLGDRVVRAVPLSTENPTAHRAGPFTIQMDLPSLQAQKRIVMELATEEAVSQLRANLNAPAFPPQSDVVEPACPTHLRRRSEGWAAPSAEVVCAYFRHFQQRFPAYGSDAQLAALLELGSGDRRIREYKAGTVEIPYRVWRRFLVLTGRAVQEITPVMAFMG